MLPRVSINDWSEDIQIAELLDDPSFSEDMTSLATRYQAIVDAVKAGREAPHTPDLVLDLRRVHFLNSTNIAQLLRLRKLAMTSGARIRMCSVSDRIWGVLLATDLDRIFDFSEDATTALVALQMARGTP